MSGAPNDGHVRGDFMQARTVLVAALLAAAPGMAAALGLGPITVSSALNEPMRARIELVAAGTSELDTFEVGLADADLFERAGIPRGDAARNLRFEVVRGEGRDYVLVTSEEPVREPALEFVVEAAWAGGRAVRTYTVLLGLR